MTNPQPGDTKGPSQEEKYLPRNGNLQTEEGHERPIPGGKNAPRNNGSLQLRVHIGDREYASRAIMVQRNMFVYCMPQVTNRSQYDLDEAIEGSGRRGSAREGSAARIHFMRFLSFISHTFSGDVDRRTWESDTPLLEGPLRHQPPPRCAPGRLFCQRPPTLFRRTRLLETG